MFKHLVVVTLCILLCAGSLCAANIRVAVIGFEADNEKTSKNIMDLLQVNLTSSEGITLIERKDINKIYDELALNYSGAINKNDAIKAGKLLGAQVLIIGRTFMIDNSIRFIAKIIGTETSRMYVVAEQSDFRSELAPSIVNLSKKITATLRENLVQLLAKTDEHDEHIAIIKAALEGKDLPTVSVYVSEKHLKRPAPDPIVQTILVEFLKECGFHVFDADENTMSMWVKDYLETSKIDKPKLQNKADVLIVGDAFSEFALKRGDLYSCKARVEIKAIARSSGEILAAKNEKGTAIEIAEITAAKDALKDAAESITESIIIKISDQWDKLEKSKQEKKKIKDDKTKEGK